MNEPSRKLSVWTGFAASTGRVFSLFFARGRKARRTKVLFAFSFLPVVVSLMLRFHHVLSESRSFDGAYYFSNIIMVFYLNLIVLILALFYGTSVCSEEVEGRTLSYLLTRPLPRPTIVLGKSLAAVLLIAEMVGVSLLFSFLALNFGHLSPVACSRLLKYGGVLFLGVLSYSAFFVFLGSALKRSIFFGLLFSFGWENIVQYFPGSTQRLTIIHYLKSFLPEASSGRFSFLTFRLEATRPLPALLILTLVTAGFLALACLVFSKKEYLYED